MAPGRGGPGWGQTSEQAKRFEHAAPSRGDPGLGEQAPEISEWRCSGPGWRGRPSELLRVEGCRSQEKGKLGELWGSPPPFSNDRTLRVTPRGKRAVFKKKSVHAHQHASDVSVPRRQRLTCHRLTVFVMSLIILITIRMCTPVLIKKIAQSFADSLSTDHPPSDMCIDFVA